MERLIIDTDLGYDCDDAGALAVANIMKNSGEADVLAVTHSVNRKIGAEAIKLINNYYGNPDISVGIAERYAIDVDRFFEEFYAKFRTDNSFPGWGEKPSFYKLFQSLNLSEYESVGFGVAKDVMADALLKSKDGSVTVVCIGQANNAAEMLNDCTVAGQNMTYRELFRKKVRRIVIMCGNFSEYDGEYLLGGLYWRGEFNVLLDINSAKKLFSETDLPVYVLDFNQGKDVLSGSGLADQADNPVRKMYLTHGNGRETELPSWDVMAVMFASGRFDELFFLSERGTVVIEDSGKSVFQAGKGNHFLIRRKVEANVFSGIINGIFKSGNRRAASGN